MMPLLSRNASDAQLLRDSARSRRAFASFYDRYEQAVVGYFMRRTGDPELAADLTAEVFAAVLTAAAHYQPAGPSAAPWLFTIAHNTLVSSARKGRVEEAARRELGIREAIGIGAASRARLEHVVVGDAWVAELLKRLPQAQREAVRARVLEDKSYDEIAAVLDTSSLVIRQRVSRGLAALRQEVRDEI
jgi:RNA polymerase sigma-70 factor, ECF subfamily